MSKHKGKCCGTCAFWGGAQWSKAASPGFQYGYCRWYKSNLPKPMHNYSYSSKSYEGKDCIQYRWKEAMEVQK